MFGLSVICPAPFLRGVFFFLDVFSMLRKKVFGFYKNVLIFVSLNKFNHTFKIQQNVKA